MKYITSDGCSLYYEFIDNKKPVLIMLHGNGEDHTYFKHQREVFQKAYSLLLIDMRGHGKSEMGNIPLDFSLFAKDVISIMDERDIGQADILGFSDGASTAMTLAIHYAKRVHSLILNGANMNPKGIKTHVQLPITLGYYLLKVMPSKKAKEKFQIMQLMVDHPHIQKAQLSNITQPVLILCGDHDMVKAEHSRYIASCFMNSQFVCLHGSHFIARENVEEYNQCILDFLLNNRKKNYNNETSEEWR